MLVLYISPLTRYLSLQYGVEFGSDAMVAQGRQFTVLFSSEMLINYFQRWLRQ